jgi:2',3'-cyclic-nucleotide 2'-phosphodiesterase (5'-nucleotidase family)
LGPGTPTEISKLTAEIIISSFNKIGCHAFSPGSKDFAAGLNFVKEMQNLAKFPFISANIFDINGNRLFDPYTIIDVSGLSVGVIGLASRFTNSEVYVNNPIESLNEIVSEVNNQSDVLLLLFDSQESDISQIQETEMPIDLIIRSKSRTRSQDGGVKRIPSYSCGDRGKYLYQFDLTIIDPSKNFTDLAIYQNKKSKAEKILNKMRKGNVVSDLHNLYKDDPLSLKKIKTHENQIQSANIALENSINTISIKKHELGKTIIDRPDILKIVDKGKKRIEKNFGPQLPVKHDHNNDGIPDH